MASFSETQQPKGGTDIPAVHFPFMSREISNLTPDRSKEFLYQGLGKAMEQGSQLADTAYTSVVKSDTRSSVDPMQKEYEDRLQAVDDQLHGSPTGLDPSSTSLVSQTAQQYGQLPGDLKSLPRQLDMRESARANGKISETQHYRDIIDIATRLRAKYPGKTDLIDAEISRITGVHPANQYVRSLLGDINSFIDSGKEARNKVETLANKGLTDGDVSWPQYKKWQDTGDDSIIYKAVAAGGEARARYQRREHEFNENKWNDEDQLKEAKSIATDKGYDVVSHFMDSVGIDDKHLEEAISGMATGKYDYDPEAVATSLNIGIKQAESKLRRELSTKSPGQDKSIAQRLGAEETEKVIAASMKELNDWRDAIKHGDLDVATLAARQVKAIQAGGALALYRDKDVGAIAAVLKTIKDDLGPEAFTMFWQKNNEAWKSFSSLSEKSAFMDDAKRLAQRPTATVGPVDSFNKMLKENQTRQTATPKLNDKLIDMTQGLLGKNVPPEVVASVVQKVYGVGNEGNVDLFNKTADKYNVYGRLVSTEGTDRIWKAAKDTNNPEVFASYQAWAEQSFGKIMRNDIHEFTQAKNDYSGVQIKYDPEGHQFIAAPQQGTMQAYYGTAKVPPALNSLVNRLNGAIYNLNHVYEKSGQSTDIYLYKALTGAGLQGSVADSMIDAVVDAHGSGSGKEKPKK